MNSIIVSKIHDNGLKMLSLQIEGEAERFSIYLLKEETTERLGVDFFELQDSYGAAHFGEELEEYIGNGLIESLEKSEAVLMEPDNIQSIVLDRGDGLREEFQSADLTLFYLPLDHCTGILSVAEMGDLVYFHRERGSLYADYRIDTGHSRNGCDSIGCGFYDCLEYSGSVGCIGREYYDFVCERIDMSRILCDEARFDVVKMDFYASLIESSIYRIGNDGEGGKSFAKIEGGDRKFTLGI